MTLFQKEGIVHSPGSESFFVLCLPVATNDKACIAPLKQHHVKLSGCTKLLGSESASHLISEGQPDSIGNASSQAAGQLSSGLWLTGSLMKCVELQKKAVVRQVAPLPTT